MRRLKYTRWNLEMCDDDVLYEVHADYRGDKYDHYKYYVRAKDKSDATEYFKRVVTWLKVYRVRMLSASEASLIIKEHNEMSMHVIFWRGGATSEENVYEEV